MLSVFSIIDSHTAKYLKSDINIIRFIHFGGFGLYAPPLNNIHGDLFDVVPLKVFVTNTRDLQRLYLHSLIAFLFIYFLKCFRKKVFRAFSLSLSHLSWVVEFSNDFPGNSSTLVHLQWTQCEFSEIK